MLGIICFGFKKWTPNHPQKLLFWGPYTPAVQVQTPSLEGPKTFREYLKIISHIVMEISVQDGPLPDIDGI